MRLHGIGRDAWKRYTAAGTWYYEIEAAGFKDNLTDLAAAIGLAQLERAQALREARAAIAARYLEGLADAGAGRARSILPATGAGDEHAWHLFVIRLGDDARPADAIDAELPGVAGLPPALRPARRAAPARSTRSARRASERASISSRSTCTRSIRGWATGPASSRPPRPPTPARSACRSGLA